MNIAEILNKHVGEDGKLNVAGAEKELKQEVAKEYVPKHEFNSKNDQLKDANDTIAKLQKDNKDNEDLQNTIAELQAKADKAEAELTQANLIKDAEDSLREKGVTNIKFALFELGDLERGEDGEIKDFETKFKTFAEQNPDFVKAKEEAPKPPTFKGSNPAAPSGATDPEKLSYGARFGKQVAEQLKK